MRLRFASCIVLPLWFVAACSDAPGQRTGDPDLAVTSPDLAPPPDLAGADLIVTPSTLAAFPGAEGFGAAATGGRGGKVLYVTTLAKSGPGSLQAALDESGARTILFKVSGMIEGVPIATHGDFTLAGQSSPGGIAMRGLLIQGDQVCEGPSAPDCPNPTVAPSNFIVRHVRLRPGDFGDPDGAGDGLRLHHAKNGVIDHVSVGNAEDEAMQVSFTSDVSIQYCMLAETIGGHAEFGGMLMNYSDPARGYPLTRLSIHHNVWNRIFGRMPEISRENIPDDQVLELELSNNLLYDHQRPIYIASANPMNDDPLSYRLNLVGNYSVQNPTRAQCYGLVAVELGPDPTKPSFTAGSSIFFADNRMSRTTRTDYELIYGSNDYCDTELADGLPWGNGNTARPPQAKDARHDFPAITYTVSGQPLVDWLVARAGAFPRDPMDTRLMADPDAGTFAAASHDTNPAGDLDQQPFVTAPTAPTDTDGDGMPDAWETTNGLDPNAAADGNTTTLSTTKLGVAGYTNLEVYLHERAEAILLP